MVKQNRKDNGKKTHPYSYILILTAVFVAVAAVLYWFWAVPYRSALGYREQLQLFQTTGAYFLSLMPRPGGMATYIGEFLTQFFNNYWLDAAVMSGMLTLFLLGCHKAIRRLTATMSPYAALALAFTPLVALLLFLVNPDVTMNFVTALTSVMWATVLYLRLDAGNTTAKRCIIRQAVMTLLFTTLLYGLCGPATIIFTLLAIVSGCRHTDLPATYKAIPAIVSVLWLAANVWIWSPVLPYPLTYQLIGIGYMMMPDALYVGEIIVVTLCILVPSMACLMARLPQKNARPTA